MSAATIARTNAKRQKERGAVYDPIRGVGGPLARVAVPHLGGTVYVPKRMAETPSVRRLIEAGSMEAFAAEQRMTPEVVAEHFTRLRWTYDFEFWCATCASIKMDAETRLATGQVYGPLVLNRAQRLYLPVLMEAFEEQRPIRVILLKARQWGGSTMTQLFMAWLQQEHYEAWNAFVASLTDPQAAHIREMYETLARHYPSEAGTITFKGYQGGQKVKQVAEHSGIVAVTSVQTPEGPRGYTVHMAHLSEVGLWPSTPKVNAKSLVQSFTGTIPQVPGSLLVMESTAKGSGTYFHSEWEAATATPPRSSFAPVFIPWFEIPKYEEPVEDAKAFAATLDEYEAMLFDMGATLEGIKWYRTKLMGFSGDRMQMQSEYPSTPEEAFQSTGSRVFGAPHVAAQRKNVAKGEAGRLVAKSETGREALQDIRFRPDETTRLNHGGGLVVWRKPGDRLGGLVPEGKRVVNRYAAFADFGGKSEKADWSVCTVVDRAMMLWGGDPEVVARLRVHIRPDLYAWQSARLCAWYDNALLAYETNRHSRDRGDEVRGYEPEWSFVALEEVGGVYPNLYLRHSQSRIDDQVSKEIGFHTSGGAGGSKALIINTLDRLLEDGGYVERDSRALAEMDVYETKPNGSMGAVAGKHDDIVISTAGALWLACGYMDPPALVSTERPKRRRPATSSATF